MDLQNLNLENCIDSRHLSIKLKLKNIEIRNKKTVKEVFEGNHMVWPEKMLEDYTLEHMSDSVLITYTESMMSLTKMWTCQ